MAVTAEELVVQFRSEGAGETRQEISGVEDELEKTTDTVEDQSSQMTRFTSKIRGAMKALVAGFAVAVGGLATQMPIIGELFSGMVAIVQSLAFQLDRNLRPALQPIVSGMYELSNAIAAGDWDQVRQMFGDLANTIAGVDWGAVLREIGGILTGIGSALIQFAGSVDWGQLLKNIVTRIAAFVESVDWLGLAGDILRALFENLGNMINNIDWFGWLNDIIAQLIAVNQRVDWARVADDIWTFIVDGLTDIITTTDWASVLQDLGNAIIGAVEGGLKVTEILVETGKEIGNWILSGIVNWLVTTDWIGWATDLYNTISKAVSEIDWKQVGIDIGKELGLGLGQSILDLAADLEIGGTFESRLIETGADIAGASARARQDETFQQREAPAASSFEAPINLDGRNMTEQTGRYRRDGTARRGVD